MELTLVRKYENNKSFNLFALTEGKMDVFIIGNFSNEDDMIAYFNQMPPVYKNDGSVDLGKFYLTSKEDDEIVFHDIYFRDDYDKTLELLQTTLLNDNAFLKLLINNCPQIFIADLKERIEKSLLDDFPPIVRNINVGAFENTLIKGILMENYRKVYSIIKGYIEEKQLNINVKKKTSI